MGDIYSCFPTKHCIAQIKNKFNEFLFFGSIICLFRQVGCAVAARAVPSSPGKRRGLHGRVRSSAGRPPQQQRQDRQRREQQRRRGCERGRASRGRASGYRSRAGRLRWGRRRERTRARSRGFARKRGRLRARSLFFFLLSNRINGALLCIKYRLLCCTNLTGLIRGFHGLHC